MFAEVAGVTTDVTQIYDPSTGKGDGYSAAGNGRWGNGLGPTFPVRTMAKRQAPLWDTGLMSNSSPDINQTTMAILPKLRGTLGALETEPNISGSGRHLNGANYAFVDGHVKWLRPKNVSNGADAKKPGAPADPMLGLAESAARNRFTFSRK